MVSSRPLDFESQPFHCGENAVDYWNVSLGRVANTLQVRGWEYVNYGFLLKGLEMERDITRPGHE